MGKPKKSTKKFNRKSLEGELKKRRKYKQQKAKFQNRNDNKKDNLVKEDVKTRKRKDELEYVKLTGERKTDNLDIFEQLEIAEDFEENDVSMEEQSEEEAEEEMEYSEEEAHEENEDSQIENSEDDEMEEDEYNEEEQDDIEELEEEEEEELDEEDLEKEALKHKNELVALKEKDPKFYKFLEENDKSLLGFGEDEEEDIDEDMGDNLDEESTADKAKVLSLKQIESWETGIVKDRSLNHAKELILAFKEGAHINETDEERTKVYIINSDKIFNKLMVVSMRSLPPLFDFHTKHNSKSKGLPSSSKKWKRISPLVKSYIESISYIMDTITETEMIQFMLERTQNLIKYVSCFPKLLRIFMKLWLNYFGSFKESKIQLLAFSLIRKASIISSFALDLALKGVYTTYVRSSKAITAYNASRLNLMRSCGVELYGHNFDKSYQLGFTSIRQLAIHLRNSINTKSKESLAQVYNWQFISSLTFWSQVLSTYCNKEIELEHGESPLRPLIYPLTQITLGTIRLIPSPKYFPLRLHCIKSLVNVSQKTGVYIPIAPYLIEILESAEFQRRPFQTKAKMFNMDLVLKTPNECVGSKIYQDMLADEINELLLAHFASFSNSIAFPELVLPTVHYLKKFKKSSKNMKICKLIEQLIAKIDATSKIIQAERSQLEFAPNDLEKMDAFINSHSTEDTPIAIYYKKVLEVKQKRKAILEAEMEDEV